MKQGLSLGIEEDLGMNYRILDQELVGLEAVGRRRELCG